MKRFFYVLFIMMLVCSCSTPPQKEIVTDKPWNVSVYLDLSDRLTKGKGESQLIRDTAIISFVVDQFVDNVVKHKIVPCNDKLQIFFYPTDEIINASSLSRELVVNLHDFASQPASKKQKLKTMKADLMSTIIPIYNETLKNSRWLGSDIWGFFKKRVKTLCIEKDYRNVLIILTDGYIYHQNSRLKNGNEFSYILPSNINTSDLKLMRCQTDLAELEVLFLEINPSRYEHFDKMQNIISTWLEDMGVEHYQIEETDVTANITPVIKAFLQEDYASSVKY